MQAPEERIIRMGEACAPRLSVLTPFYRHDPSALIAALGRAPADVEFVMLDDGTADEALIARVTAALAALGAPAQLIVCAQNIGRSAARNRLIAAARGEYVLFLDADMIPDRADFLSTWLSVIAAQRPTVAFGGLSLAQVSPTPTTALHHDIFSASDCHNAARRAHTPAQSTAASNLLVRRDFLIANPFDDNFTGWGFEDTDWALRAAQHAPIVHVDNPASHDGLDDVATLLRKSAEAGPNFARLARRHPRAVSRFAAHRAARALRKLPARSQLRALSAWLTGVSAAPMPLRRAAFKLYRASHFAEHLS